MYIYTAKEERGGILGKKTATNTNTKTLKTYESALSSYFYTTLIYLHGSLSQIVRTVL